MQSIGPWIALVVILILVGMAWRYGIIRPVVHTLLVVVVGIWHLVCDLANNFREFLRSTFGQIGT